MNVIKYIAWVCIFGIGMLGLGTVAAVAGTPWGTVALIWIGCWIGVAVLAELASPSRYH